MSTAAFLPAQPRKAAVRQTARMCDAKPPKDPTRLRTESQRRRNSPPKPLRRKKRRSENTDPLDWDAMTSVPLVRPDAPPESGEDYWWELDKAVKLGDPDLGSGARARKPKRDIDPNLKKKLKEEVVSPYTQNWILWVGAVVLVLVLAVWVFGGSDTIPIIGVPDL